MNNGKSILKGVDEIENKIKKININIPNIPRINKKKNSKRNDRYLEENDLCNKTYCFSNSKNIKESTEQNYHPDNYNNNFREKSNKSINKNKMVSVLVECK